MKFDAGILRESKQRRSIIGGNILLDRLERESAIHCAALKVHVAQFAREARCDGALPRSGRAVNGDH